MAISRNQVAVGSLVNPLEGLQKAMKGVSDYYSDSTAREEEQRRYELELARQAKADERADLLFQQGQDKLKREEVQRKALGEYDPAMGIGGKGYEEKGLRAYSELTAKDVQYVQNKYGLGTTTTLGQLQKEPNRFKEYLKDIDAVSAEATSDYGSGNLIKTKESVGNAMFKDLLKITGDVGQASAAAKQFADSSGLPSRADIQEAEKLRAKAAEARRKEFQEQGKYAFEARRRAAEKAGKSKSGIKTGMLYRDDVVTKIGEELDLSSKWIPSSWRGDEKKALEWWEKAVDAGVDPTIAYNSLKQGVSRGFFGDSLGEFTEADYLKFAGQQHAKAKSKGFTTDMTEAEKKAIFSDPITARSLDTVLTTGGVDAYKSGNAGVPRSVIEGPVQQTPAPASPAGGNAGGQGVGSGQGGTAPIARTYLDPKITEDDTLAANMMDEESMGGFNEIADTSNGIKKITPKTYNKTDVTLMQDRYNTNFIHNPNKSDFENDLQAFKVGVKNNVNKAIDTATKGRVDMAMSWLEKGAYGDVKAPEGTIFSYFTDTKKDKELRKKDKSVVDWYKSEGKRFLYENPKYLKTVMEDPRKFYENFSKLSEQDGTTYSDVPPVNDGGIRKDIATKDTISINLLPKEKRQESADAFWYYNKPNKNTKVVVNPTTVGRLENMYPTGSYRPPIEKTAAQSQAEGMYEFMSRPGTDIGRYVASNINNPKVDKQALAAALYSIGTPEAKELFNSYFSGKFGNKSQAVSNAESYQELYQAAIKGGLSPQEAAVVASKGLLTPE